MDCPTLDKSLANVVRHQEGRVCTYKARNTSWAFVGRRGRLKDLVGCSLGHDNRCNVPKLALSRYRSKEKGGKERAQHSKRK